MNSNPIGSRSAPGESSLVGGRRRTRRTGLVVCLIGVGLTTFFFLAARKRENVLSGLEFDRRSLALTAAIRDGLAAPLEGLKFLPAFFEASTDVTREEFETFVRESLRGTLGVYAFEWVPIVKRSERARYEAAARADGVEDFSFRQLDSERNFVLASERDVYLPIFYQEPFHPETIGLDLAVLPLGERLVERLNQTTSGVASQGVWSARDPDLGTFVAVHRGVFRGEGERRHLSSLVNVLVLIRDILEEEREDGHMTGFHVALVDDDAEEEAPILFEDVPGSLAAIQLSGLRSQTSIPFADRRWTLQLAPTSDSDILPGSMPWLVLGTGLGFSVLLGLGALMLERLRGLRKQVVAALELGQYRLEEKVGAGGMGDVYRAKHAMLRRPTAIKLLRAEAADEAGLARFEREVQLTSALTHPNTVAIYDYGRTPDGVFYYAMEYLEGMSFETLVNEYGPLSEARAIHFLLQVCGSLSEAHNAGLIHRDVKPANIMVCRRGGQQDVSKLVDFGLVKKVHSDAEPEVTQAGSITGTPFYIAPETIRSAETIDARSDLYSVGAVAYFLVTGKRVFSGNVIEILGDHLGKTPTRPSERLGKAVAPDLEAVILNCLEKDPEARPQTAAELSVALSKCRDAGRWTQQEAVAWWKQREKSARRGRAAAPVLGDAPTMQIDLGDR